MDYFSILFISCCCHSFFDCTHDVVVPRGKCKSNNIFYIANGSLYLKLLFAQFFPRKQNRIAHSSRFVQPLVIFKQLGGGTIAGLSGDRGAASSPFITTDYFPSLGVHQHSCTLPPPWHFLPPSTVPAAISYKE